MTTKKSKLRQDLDKALNGYIKTFCKKQGVDYEFSVHGDLLGVGLYSDMYLNMSDVVLDIDTEAPAGKILDWYWGSLESHERGCSTTISYESWLMGLRYEDLTSK